VRYGQFELLFSDAVDITQDLDSSVANCAESYMIYFWCDISVGSCDPLRFAGLHPVFYALHNLAKFIYFIKCSGSELPQYCS